MLLPCLLVLAIFAAYPAFSQVEAQAQTAAADSLAQLNKARVDSLQVKQAAVLDSASQLSDKLISLTDSIPSTGDYTGKLDSLAQKLSFNTDSVNQFTNKITQLTDSLPSTAKFEGKLDSLRQRFTLRTDTLNKFGRPAAKIQGKLDSIQQKNPLNKLNDAGARVEAVTDKATQPISNVQGKVNEKLSLMDKESGGQSGLPGQVQVPGLQSPGLNPGQAGGLNSPSLPGMDQSALGGMNMPGIDTPGLNSMDNPLEGKNLPTDQLDKLNEIGSMPQEQLDKLNNIDELGKAKDGLGKVKEVGGEVSKYGEDIKNVSTGDIGSLEAAPKALEGKLSEVEQVQGIQKEMTGADEYKEMLGKGNDPEAMKKMAAEEVKKQAVDHFAGKGEQLSNAMNKISGLKLKYSNVKSLKDLPKRPPNPMKGKPMIERLVPGLVLQIQVSEHWLIDYNPVLGYRLGGRVTVGAGWNQRVAIGSDFKTYSDERVYGPRVYGEFKFGKGFAVRADVEKLNTFIPPLGFNGVQPEGSREWVWSAFVGLKKDYKFMKNVMGNFQFLYNVYDDHDNSPYADRLVVRTGFEFPMRKKVKKSKKKVVNK